MSSNNIPEGYYSEEQIAQMLNKAISTLRLDHSRRSDRVPPKTKIGNRILYKISSFEKWIEGKETQTFDHKKRRDK